MMRSAATVTTVLLALVACGQCFAQAGPKAANPVYDAERKVLEFLAFSKPFECEGCQEEDSDKPGVWNQSGSGIAIYAKYKTLNMDNQPETVTKVFIIGHDNGFVFYGLSPDKFRTGSKADPFSSQFVR
jgi:hypothetical protein